MTYYRHHNIRGSGVCLTLVEFWFYEPGEEKAVCLKGSGNVIEHHMKKGFIVDYFQAFLL